MSLPLDAIGREFRFYLDILRQYNLLPARSGRQMEEQRFQTAFAKNILRGKRPRVGGHEFSMVTLRSLAGTDVRRVIVVDRTLKPRDGLTAFLGHRFTESVTRNLRHNLQLVLKLYGISLLYSDTDVPNGSIFEVILRRIKEASFCIFDDRETEVRPNVFIELGAAVALERPYFYFRFEQKRTVRMGRRKERIQAPSDLAGMLCLPYSTYEDLLREFAVRLPRFLLDRKLAHSRRA